MADPLEIFAANLARLRDARGWTQEQLALEAGMKMEEISRFERKVREPKLRTIFRLAAALGVDPNTLLDATRVQNDKSPRPQNGDEG